jgi:tRNA U34 2-thiouridine synthase MnmA/TrmU
VCFLGNISVEEFLRAEFGSDNPALLYTLGQRVPRPGGPWYVVGKDVEKKEIIVSKTPISAERSIAFRDANWLEKSRETVEAQYRYRGPRVAGRLESLTFQSSEPLPEIPVPGQSIVFYKDTELIGGGIITL